MDLIKCMALTAQWYGFAPDAGYEEWMEQEGERREWVRMVRGEYTLMIHQPGNWALYERPTREPVERGDRGNNEIWRQEDEPEYTVNLWRLCLTLRSLTQ